MEDLKNPDVLSVDASKINNAVLRRLIEEVQSDNKNGVNNYNRLHNRHNRTPGPRPTYPRPTLPDPVVPNEEV